jgi:hypothetical protein
VPLPTQKKQLAAMEIVVAEEGARGWEAVWVGSWAKEKELGCDLLSTPPDGSEPFRVEVKGWGEPLFTQQGRFRYGQDIRVSQLNAALAHERYRIEIVANLDAYLRGEGSADRLTLYRHEILERVIPRLYDIPLDGLESRAFSYPSTDEPANEGDSTPRVIDGPVPEPGPGMEPGCPEDAFTWPGPPVAVASADLSARSVPSDEATFAEVSWFAASFDGYAFLELESLAAVANTMRDYFIRLGFTPPDLDLDTLRACLFFEYRRFHHFGHGPGVKDALYLRALITAIRRRVVQLDV